MVDGDFVGLHADGSAAAGNNVGVLTDGEGVTIGGSTPAARNVISGNGVGLRIASNSVNYVSGNLIGTDPPGMSAIGNGTGVVLVTAAIVGQYYSAPDRNVISGNVGNGIEGAGVIAANLIGLDVTGLKALGNGGSGIVGGGTIATNVISGNALHGIDISSGSVSANFIGLNVYGLGEIGNGGAGVHTNGIGEVSIGSNGPFPGNQIAHNRAGIWLEYPAFLYDQLVDGNSTFDNGGLGIVDGPGPAVHPNGAGLPFPIITSVVPNGSTTTVSGFYDGGASLSITLSFYTSPACSKRRPWHFDEGKTFVSTYSTSTDASGHVSFTTDLPVVITDEVLLANATYLVFFPPPLSAGEGGSVFFRQGGPFSQRLPYAIAPSSGSPAGGDAITIAGTNFEAGATVTMGGAAAGSVNIVGPTEIDVTAPVLPAGAAYDVTVVNPDGSRGTIPLAWVADFLDVPPAHMFHDYVRALLTNGVATGVGGGNFGVDASTLRQQMAVFLLKAKHGICYTPPPCAGTFADVPCPSLFADWIEALAAEGITGGCGGGNYCPGDAVRRDQMAAFLLKAEHGSTYVPPACAGVFPDVACPSLFADWIEQLAAENVTGGCGGGNYCPLNPNTRGQMAVFLAKTFQLQ